MFDDNWRSSHQTASILYEGEDKQRDGKLKLKFEECRCRLQSKDKNYVMCEVGELSGMESCEAGD